MKKLYNDNTIYVRTYKDLPFDAGEALRYAGGGDDQINEFLREVWQEVRDQLAYKICYRFYPVTGGDALDLGFAVTDSKDLARNLTGCSQIILFAATVGFGIDRAIMRHQKLAPSKALLMQGVGAAQVEVLCNKFCAEIRDEIGPCKPRFSPGFGDLPLALQRDIFAALDPERKIGVTLNDSLLMTPTKSVTAVIGICDNDKR